MAGAFQPLKRFGPTPVGGAVDGPNQLPQMRAVCPWKFAQEGFEPRRALADQACDPLRLGALARESGRIGRSDRRLAVEDQRGEAVLKSRPVEAAELGAHEA